MNNKPGLKVTIDPHRCIGMAKCTTVAPGVYTIDEETRKAVLEHADEATVEQLFAGARVCPTQAIIIEQYGNRIYPQIMPAMFGDPKPEDDNPSE